MIHLDDSLYILMVQKGAPMVGGDWFPVCSWGVDRKLGAVKVVFFP